MCALCRRCAARPAPVVLLAAQHGPLTHQGCSEGPRTNIIRPLASGALARLGKFDLASPEGLSEKGPTFSLAQSRSGLSDSEVRGIRLQQLEASCPPLLCGTCQCVVVFRDACGWLELL